MRDKGDHDDDDVKYDVTDEEYAAANAVADARQRGEFAGVKSATAVPIQQYKADHAVPPLSEGGEGGKGKDENTDDDMFNSRMAALDRDYLNAFKPQQILNVDTGWKEAHALYIRSKTTSDPP